MVFKQVIFKDFLGRESSGILLDNGDIISMLCGVLFPADTLEDAGIEITYVFPRWVDVEIDRETVENTIEDISEGYLTE